MIKRLLEREIGLLMRQFPAVAILGARQVGKTTLARQLASVQKKPTLYLDLENPLDARKLEDAYTFLTDNKDKCIIIDEVQIIPSLFAVLRSVIDSNRRNGKFILLGSASPQLVRGISESLAGRIVYKELSPLNLVELPESIPMDKHWLRGGFPSSLLARSGQASAEWLNSFIRSYAERDLSVLFGVGLSSNIINRLLSMLAHTNGNVWNAEMIGRSLGITAPTVNRYIEFLEGAFLVHRLQTFHINTRKRLVKAPKIYLRDSGLLHRLSGVSNLNFLKGHPVVGASWEGYVVEQIKEIMPQGLQMYYYRTQAGAELDVILANGIHPVAGIEIKLNNAPTLSKGNLQSIEDLKTKRNFVIVPAVEDYKLRTNILVCNIHTFLKKHLLKL